MNVSKQFVIGSLEDRNRMRDANIEQTRTAIELQDYRYKTPASRCRDYSCRAIVIVAAFYLVFEVVNAFGTGAIQAAVQ